MANQGLEPKRAEAAGPENEGAEHKSTEAGVITKNSLCPGPCLEASADTFIYQATYAHMYVPRAEKVPPHGKEPHPEKGKPGIDWRFTALTQTVKSAMPAGIISKKLDKVYTKEYDPLFQLGILFRERIRTRPIGFTIERAPFYEISIPPGDMVTLKQRSFSRRTRSLQEELTTESEKKLELSSSFTTEMNDELTRVIESSTQWSEGTSASAGIGYSVFSAALSYENSTTVNDMNTETARQMRRTVEEAVRKIESRQKSTHKTVMEVTSEESLASESIRILHNYSTALKKIFMRRLLQVLHVTHERYDAQLCWAPCVEKPKQKFVMTSEAEKAINDIRQFYATALPPEGTLNVPTPVEQVVTVAEGDFNSNTSDHKHLQEYISVPAGWQVSAVNTFSEAGHTCKFLSPGSTCPKGDDTPNYPQPIGNTSPSVMIYIHLGKPYLHDMDYKITASLSPTTDLQTRYNAALAAWRASEMERKIAEYIDSLQQGSEDFEWSPHVVMREIIRTHFAGGGTTNLPDLSADPGCPIIQRMHALFEWENMSIRFFPPAWSGASYGRHTDVENASAAKVFIPVRKKKEEEAIALLTAYQALPPDAGATTIIGTYVADMKTNLWPSYEREYKPVDGEDQEILASNSIGLTERSEASWRNMFEKEGRFRLIDRFVTTLPTDGVDFEEALTECPIPYPVQGSSSDGGNGEEGEGCKGGRGKHVNKHHHEGGEQGEGDHETEEDKTAGGSQGCQA